jgi:hypothetical protein
MDPHLLHLATALGLAAAVGLNTTLPLLLIGLAPGVGLLPLAPPYDALSAPVTLIVLALLTLSELTGDKFPMMDTLLQTLQFPFTLAAGAIIAGTQAAVISATHPELVLLLGLTMAGGVHLARATIRPLVHLLPLHIAGTALSLGEDAGAVLLVGIALAVPPLAPVALLILLIVWMVLLYGICRVLLHMARQGLRFGEQLLRFVVGRLGGRPAAPVSAGAAVQPPLPVDIWNDEPGMPPAVPLPDRRPAPTARPDIWDV